MKNTTTDTSEAEKAKAEKVLLTSPAGALGIIYDATTDSVMLATESEFLDEVRDAASKNTQREFTEASLSATADAMGDSDHFLLRTVDPPIFDKITMGQIAQAKWEESPMSSSDTKSSAALTIRQLMPDTQATSKTKRELGDINEAEEILGEHFSKRTKMNTEFTAVSEINNLAFLLSTMANVLMIMRMYHQFETPRALPPF